MMSKGGIASKIALFVATAGLIALVVVAVRDTPSSLPGDFAYPFKGVIENLRISQQDFEFNYAGSTSIYLDLLQARLSEIEQLVKKGDKDEKIIATAKTLLELQRKAMSNFSRAKNQKKEDTTLLFSRFESILEQEQSSNFLELTFEVSPATAGALSKVIEQSKIDLERLKSMGK